MAKACNLPKPVVAVASGTGADPDSDAGPYLNPGNPVALPAAQSPLAQNPVAPGPVAPSPVAPSPVAEPDGLLIGLPPVVGPNTRLLLLGSFPSVASLAAQQYYGHPRNQFWPLLSALWGFDLRAMPYPQRLDLVRQRGLGIWDIYARCRRPGSLDAAITEAQRNPLAALASTLPALAAIAHNGGESARVMKVTAALGLPVYRLPSSSPANASWSFERKRQAWAAVFAAHGMMAPL